MIGQRRKGINIVLKRIRPKIMKYAIMQNYARHNFILGSRQKFLQNSFKICDERCKVRDVNHFKRNI